MSTHRSSSGDGIRQLRARFENNSDPNLPPLRGQSPSNENTKGHSSSRSPAGPRKIRSSFVSVEPSGHQGTAMSSQDSTNANSASISQRRESFSMDPDSEAVQGLKKTLSNEAERRKSVQGMEDELAPETAISSAMPTPIPEAQEPLSPGFAAAIPQRPAAQPNTSASSLRQTVLAPEIEKQSEHQEKSVSAVEDKGAEMRPADPTQKSNVTGGQAIARGMRGGKAPNLDGQAEQGQGEGMPSKLAAPTKSSSSRLSTAAVTQKSAKKVTRPSTTGPNASSRSAGLGRSTVTSDTAAIKHRQPTRTVPLPSHLTQPTASSKAKHEEEPAANRRVTSGSRPSQVPAHLMAPTASSKAKHDENPLPNHHKPGPAPTKRDRTSLATSSNAAANRRSAARPSLMGRADGHQPEVKPATTSTKAPASGFLDRMMKPTAASASKTHDKPEDESPEEKSHPPKPSQPSKPPARRVQPNGTASQVKTPPTSSAGPGKAPSSSSKASQTSPSASRSTKQTPSPTVPAKQPKVEPSPSLQQSPPIASSPSKSTKQPSSPTATTKRSKTQSSPTTTKSPTKPSSSPTSVKQAPSTIAKASPSKPSPSKPSPSKPSSSPTSAKQAISPTSARKSAAQPASASKPSPKTSSPKQPHTPSNQIMKEPPGTNGQQDQPDQSEQVPSEWNAASLPRTPHSQTRESPMTNGVHSNAGSAQQGAPTNKATEAAKQRRSMMETPELGGGTIH